MIYLLNILQTPKTHSAKSSYIKER